MRSVMSRSRLRIDHRVPITSREMFASPYSEIPVDQNDPRGCEPLVSLTSVKVAFECYYAKTDGKNPPFGRAIDGAQKTVWLRSSVAEKLGRVNELLRPLDAELFVFDGHRSVACQQGLWNFYNERAKQENPNRSEAERHAWVRQFVVDPASFDEHDSRTWQAHTNGGAVDLTLRNSVSGQLLEMGAEIEVDADKDRSASDYFERELLARHIDEDDVRLQHRRLLHWAMTHEGLLNETAKVFWHYDWGNQTYVRASRVFLPDAP